MMSGSDGKDIPISEFFGDDSDSDGNEEGEFQDRDQDGVWRPEWKRRGDPEDMFWDPIKKTYRRRRGPRRRIRRGPYSVEEKRMIKAFDDLLAIERRMDGELAQPTCVDITVLLTALRLACARYSFENTGGDVSEISPHVVMDEVGFEISLGEGDGDDKDIWEDLR